LASLLGEGTLQDLEARVAREERRALELSAGFDPTELDAQSIEGDHDRRLAELQNEAARANQAAAGARREREMLAELLPSVAAAEEELAAAEDELDRVQRRAATLRTARDFVEKAEERVHRDIAPRLQATLGA